MKYKGLIQLIALLITPTVVIYCGGIKRNIELNNIIDQHTTTIADIKSEPTVISPLKAKTSDILSNGEILKSFNNVMIEKYTPYVRVKAEKYTIVGANLSIGGGFENIRRQIELIEELSSDIIIQSINFTAITNSNQQQRRLVAKLIIEQLIYH